MGKGTEITTSLKRLDLNSNPSKSSLFSPTLQSPGNLITIRIFLTTISCGLFPFMYVIELMIGLLSCRLGKSKPPSLVSLCLGVIGKNLQEIIAYLNDISIAFPPHIKVGPYAPHLSLAIFFVRLFASISLSLNLLQVLVFIN